MNNISPLISPNSEKMDKEDMEFLLERIVKSLSLYTAVPVSLFEDTWTLKWKEKCHALLIKE